MCRTGGRRCPSYSNPEAIAARNARRRAAYAVKKAATSSFHAEGRFGAQNASEGFSGPFAPRSFQLGGRAGSFNTLQHVEQEHDDELNLTFNLYEGEPVGNHFLSDVQPVGVINGDRLDDYSYARFGFEGFDDFESYRDVRCPSSEEETQRLKSAWNEYASAEVAELTHEEKLVLRYFTSNNFGGLNKALYTQGEGLEEGEENAMYSPEANLNAHFPRLWAWDENAATFRSYFEKLDVIVDKGPKQQRIVYRGLAQASETFEDDFEGWVSDNIYLGNELVFDGYQSTTLDPFIAGSYSNCDKMKAGLIFEISTPEGIAVSEVSEFEGEYEVILPRQSRYKIVGTHFSHELHNVTIVQLVAINNKGEALDGTNADAKTEPLPKAGA